MMRIDTAGGSSVMGAPSSTATSTVPYATAIYLHPERRGQADDDREQHFGRDYDVQQANAGNANPGGVTLGYDFGTSNNDGNVRSSSITCRII